MSKSDRRKRAARKDVKRESNGRPSRSEAAQKMRDFVQEARARQARISGREDLPGDILGILFGRGAIGDSEYSIGRKLESIMGRIYNAPTAAPSGLFRECVSVPNADDAITVQAMTDEAVEALFHRMNRTLLDCGVVVRDLVIGAVRYNRAPTTADQVHAIVYGLESLAKGHAPKQKGEPMRDAA